ncbi:gibberellin 20 oxidase 1 [Quercus suber]|uniref:Gibberellin 20 oxidase 1 n=1 Tax=Quercus suber TaxID=58331 RepID=A0AAW0L9D5_QUESU
MRLNYYPPCQKPDLSLGTRPNCDPASLTILHQDRQDQVGGLQLVPSLGEVPDGVEVDMFGVAHDADAPPCPSIPLQCKYSLYAASASLRSLYDL